MKNSEFENTDNFIKDALPFELIALYENNGSTCNIYKTRIFGKWLLIKELKDAYRDDERFIEAFRKEQELGVKLNHPNLPRYEILSDLSIDKNWVVMEFIEGDCLPDFIKSNPDYFENQAHIDKFMNEAAAAIEYLHSSQILHLDIKPQNIIITKIGRNVKLIDLGFCHSDAFQGTEGLTPGFQSPERNKGITCEADDFFGLGKLLEYIRINTPQFPVRKFKDLENDLLSHNLNKRKRRFNEIGKRNKSENPNIKSILFICLTVLIVSVLISGLLFYNQGKQVFGESPRLTENPHDTLEYKTDNMDKETDKNIKKDNDNEGDSKKDRNLNPEFVAVPNSEAADKDNDISRIEDLRRDIRSNLNETFHPIGNRIREKIRMKDYRESEYNELDRQIREGIHNATQIDRYQEKYPELSSNQIADLVAAEMQATEKNLWMVDWKLYKKEYATAKNKN